MGCGVLAMAMGIPPSLVTHLALPPPVRPLARLHEGRHLFRHGLLLIAVVEDDRAVVVALWRCESLERGEEEEER